MNFAEIMPAEYGGCQMENDFSIGTMYWLNPNYKNADFEKDCERMADNGYSLVRIIVWWELVEEWKGEYDFSFVDRFFHAAEKYGLQVMVTVGFYLPYWLTCELDVQGKNDPGRYPSLQREEVRRPLAALIEKLVCRYRNSPALAYWNIWNEPTLNTSKHERTLQKFSDYLLKKYPTWEDLKKNWQGEYPVLSLLIPPSREKLTVQWLEQAFRLGTRGRTSAINYDFLLFAADLLCEEVKWLCEEIKKYDPVHPTHSNLHAVNGNPAPPCRDFYKTAPLLDSISSSIHQSNDNPEAKDLADRVNFFCCAADRTWSWLKGGNAMIGELQVGTSSIHVCQYTPTPDTIFYELWQAYASGLHGVIHWEWQAWRSGTFESGEFGLRSPADGGETERSRKVREFAQIFDVHKDILLKVHRRPASIAILDSYSNGIYQYLQWLDHKGVPNIGQEYQKAVLGCYRALHEKNFAVDFVSEQEVENGVLSRYKVLYLPQTNLLGAKSARQIENFVNAGGAVWADGRFAWLDEHMFVRDAIPGHDLAEVFGCREKDYIAQPQDIAVKTSGGLAVHGNRMQQRFELFENAKCHAKYPDGSIAAVNAVYGKGHSRIWGIELCRTLRHESIRENVLEIADFALSAGVRPELDCPDGVTGRILENDEWRVCVLFNCSDCTQEVEIPKDADILCGSECSGGKLLLLPGKTEVLIRQKKENA